MGYAEASTPAKVGFFVAAVAFMMNIIGFPTPYWLTIPFGHFGMFSLSGASWVTAVKALEVMGFIFGLVSVVDTAVYVFVKNEAKLLFRLGQGFAFVSALFIIIGVIVFGAELRSTGYLGWSFDITAVSGILYLIAGIVLTVGRS